MKSFFKYLLASFLGVFIAFIFVFIFFLGFLGAALSKQDKTIDIKENTILHIQLKDPVVDRKGNNPFSSFDFSSMKPSSELGLNDILFNISKAKKDENISGILLDLTTINAGIASIEEIRNALIDFKSSGKFIISYSDIYTHMTYYLASVSDKIYINPEGMIPFVGLSSEIMFFKNALDKLGIEPQIIKVGKFKSAVEPFLNEGMSDANREQVKTYMGSIWNYMLYGISENRNISVKKLNELADNMTIRNARIAVEENLLDGIKYKDEILDILAEKVEATKDDPVKYIQLPKYQHVSPVREKYSKNKIAVIYASGNIVMGEAQEGMIGSERISRTIREARKDSTIKAIVLRVNSGGGSALASEVIWREVTLAKKVKPVIASLGDVAASGGYYIVAPADKIIASPNTITGSIGVFGMFFNAKGLLNDKLGINIDVVKTNDHSDLATPFRSFTAEERNVLQLGINETYETFVNHVAEGRDMQYDEVHEIGQGRVWSGINAIENGLIDEFGGLNHAVETAAQLADLEEYRTVSLPELKDPIKQILEEFSQNMEARILKRNLGQEYKYYEMVQEIRSMEGVQSRIPYSIEIY